MTDAVEYVLSRGIEAVSGALTGLTLPSPAFVASEREALAALAAAA